MEAEGDCEPLAMAFVEEEEGRVSELLPDRGSLAVGRLQARGWRRSVQAASATLLAIGLVSLLALRPESRPAGFHVGEAAEISGFSSTVSPFDAIKGSFKPDILKVEGAFTGGKCFMDAAADKCPISNMTRDKLTGVFPGGETRCLLGDTPYLFQVIPGDADKLLLYFQGGGACWDAATAAQMLCIRAVADEGRVGIFDRDNPANPYVNYTIVILGYCSGDAHVGHNDHDWTVLTSRSPKRTKQRGYINARSAIEWAKRNVGNKTLDSLIITGSSAGALGTQIWSRTLLDEFSFRAAAVIADSYAAIFPVAVQGSLMKEFGLCDRGLLTDGLRFLCQTGTVDVQQVYEAAFREWPQVAFASLDSKVDFVQLAFFKVVHKSRVGYVDRVSPSQFASSLLAVYSRYNLYPNWVSYSVNDGHHMYLNNNVMYQTTPVGNQVTSKTGMTSKFLSFAGSEITGDDLPLVKWLAEFPVRKGGSAETHCAGIRPKLPDPPKPVSLPRPGILGIISTHLGTAANVAKDSMKTASHTAVHQVASSLGFEFSCSLVAMSKTFTRRG